MGNAKEGAASSAPDYAGHSGAHTPGAWVAMPLVDEDDFDVMTARVLVHNGKGIFTAQALGHTSKEVSANARLIAAAPELAAMVRELLKIHEDHHNHPTHGAARRLLSKVEGR